MKYSRKGHKDRNRLKNRIKKERASPAGLYKKKTHKPQHPHHVKVNPAGTRKKQQTSNTMSVKNACLRPVAGCVGKTTWQTSNITDRLHGCRVSQRTSFDTPRRKLMFEISTPRTWKIWLITWEGEVKRSDTIRNDTVGLDWIGLN